MPHTQRNSEILRSQPHPIFCWVFWFDVHPAFQEVKNYELSLNFALGYAKTVRPIGSIYYFRTLAGFWVHFTQVLQLGYSTVQIGLRFETVHRFLVHPQNGRNFGGLNRQKVRKRLFSTQTSKVSKSYGHNANPENDLNFRNFMAISRPLLTIFPIKPTPRTKNFAVVPKNWIFGRSKIRGYGAGG